MKRNNRTASRLSALLNDPRIRRVESDGRTWYSPADVIALLADTQYPQQYWTDLKQREPVLAGMCEQVEVDQEVIDVVDLPGLLRLIQSIASPKAERLKIWLVQTGVQQLREIEDPELAILRTRKLYEDRGYSRQWIDKRLRSISARHELTAEWYKRGAAESDAFRTLTNELLSGTFGMDAEGYRRYKKLSRPGANLRDHMTDLELVLTMLSETVSAELHRDRSSQGVEALMRDVRDAGQVALRTRQEIEQRTSRPVVTPENAVRGGSARRDVRRSGRQVRTTHPDGRTFAPRAVKVQ